MAGLITTMLALKAKSTGLVALIIGAVGAKENLDIVWSAIFLTYE